MIRLSLLILCIATGCAYKGEVRATADYTEQQGPRAAVEVGY